MHGLYTLADCAASLKPDSAFESALDATAELALRPGHYGTAPGHAGTAPGQASFGSKHSSAFVDLKQMNAKQMMRTASISTAVRMETSA